jgi:hypothetical protein
MTRDDLPFKVVRSNRTDEVLEFAADLMPPSLSSP